VKVAIPIFNNRISPRFDFASKILIATIDNGKVEDKKAYSLINLNPIRRSLLLNELGVNVLICGGISCFSKRLLMSKWIDVINMVQGEIEEVLTLFINGKVKQ
jgi:predicted Fe-Mo cluster-binding NifX family protein